MLGSSCKYGTETSGSIKVRTFLEFSERLKKVSAPWTLFWIDHMDKIVEDRCPKIAWNYKHRLL
jgi:hypothetical protein